MKNINKLFVAMGVISFCVLTMAVVYKMVIEPAQLKSVYKECVKDARKNDYERWQDIERQIADKNKLIAELTIKADQKWGKFLENNNSMNSLVTPHKEEEEYSSWEEELNAMYLGSSRMDIEHGDIYKNVNNTKSELSNLYKQRDLGGEIFENKLKDCEKQFKMFSKSY